MEVGTSGTLVPVTAATALFIQKDNRLQSCYRLHPQTAAYTGTTLHLRALGDPHDACGAECEVVITRVLAADHHQVIGAEPGPLWRPGHEVVEGPPDPAVCDHAALQ
jgi:hypothetical protein